MKKILPSIIVLLNLILIQKNSFAQCTVTSQISSLSPYVVNSVSGSTFNEYDNQAYQETSVGSGQYYYIRDEIIRFVNSTPLAYRIQVLVNNNCGNFPFAPSDYLTLVNTLTGEIFSYSSVGNGSIDIVVKEPVVLRMIHRNSLNCSSLAARGTNTCLNRTTISVLNTSCTSTAFRDADGDGYGDVNNVGFVCGSVSEFGYVSIGGDCNDNDANVFTRTWYEDNDGDGYGNNNLTITSCVTPTVTGKTYVTLGGDCNDSDDTINPNANEVEGNNIDENCDGLLSNTRNSFAFDGNASSRNISIAHSNSLNLTSSFTIEAWIYLNASVGFDTKYIFDKKNSYSLKLYNDRLQFNDKTTSFTTLNSNEWIHVAATLDQGILRYYINGSPAGISSQTNTSGTQSQANLGTSTGIAYIGGLYFGPDSYSVFNGKIDELRIWNIAKTAQEIANSMNSFYCSSTPGLVANYKMDEGTASGNNTGITVIKDYSGNGNNATLLDYALTGTGNNFVAGKNLNLPSISSLLSYTYTTACGSNLITLSATGLSNVVWSNGATSGTPFSSTSLESTYTALSIDNNNCSSAGNIMVSEPIIVAQDLSSSIFTSISSTCGANTIVLSISGASATWSGGITNGVPFNTTATSALFTVTGFDVNGCESKGTKELSLQITNCIVVSVPSKIVFTNISTLTLTSPIILTWPSVSGIDTYCIKIYKDLALTQLVTSACGINTNSYTWNISSARLAELIDEKYYFVVASQNEAGTGEFSDPIEFIVRTESLTNSVDEVSDKFIIYPNPNTGQFNVAVNKTNTYKIVNAVGTVINAGVLNIGSNPVSVNLPRGLYFISVGTKIEKLIVE